MMQRFGSWTEYRTAPRHVVEEQIIEWSASRKAESDANAESNPS